MKEELIESLRENSQVNFLPREGRCKENIFLYFEFGALRAIYGKKSKFLSIVGFIGYENWHVVLREENFM